MDLPLSEIMMLVGAMLTLGAVTGFLAGLLGIGGGIVIVPALYYTFLFMGFPHEHLMHVAVGTSLAIIIPTGFSSARAHWKRGAVRMDIVKNMGIGILIGVVIGTLTANYVSGTGLKGVFAVAMFIVAGIMFTHPERCRLGMEMPHQPWPGLVGTAVGTLASLIGIGGAIINVPYMSAYSVPIHSAVGTASAMGILISIPAALGFILIGLGHDTGLPFTVGYLNLIAFALIFPVSALMAPVGAHVAHNTSVERLRRVFAVFVLLLATKMLHGVFYD